MCSHMIDSQINCFMLKHGLSRHEVTGDKAQYDAAIEVLRKDGEFSYDAGLMIKALFKERTDRAVRICRQMTIDERARRQAARNATLIAA